MTGWLPAMQPKAYICRDRGHGTLSLQFYTRLSHPSRITHRDHLRLTHPGGRGLSVEDGHQ